MRIWFPGVSMLISAAGIQAAEPFHEVQCDGNVRHHLQGVCTSDDSIFWCFTSEFVKTDPEGKVVKKIPVPGRHGDLRHQDGKLFVAVHDHVVEQPATERADQPFDVGILPGTVACDRRIFAAQPLDSPAKGFAVKEAVPQDQPVGSRASSPRGIIVAG